MMENLVEAISTKMCTSVTKTVSMSMNLDYTADTSNLLQITYWLYSSVPVSLYSATVSHHKQY